MNKYLILIYLAMFLYTDIFHIYTEHCHYDYIFEYRNIIILHVLHCAIINT